MELAPLGVVEENLVEQLIDITWRLKRYSRIEAAVVNELHDTAAEQPENEGKDTDQLLGKSLAHDDALNRLSRYEAQLARRYQNVMKELRELRKQRNRAAALTRLFSGPRTRPHAEPNAGKQSRPIEPTQSIATLLESIAPMGSGNYDLDPGRLSNIDCHRKYPQNPAGTGPEEAAA